MPETPLATSFAAGAAVDTGRSKTLRIQRKHGRREPSWPARTPLRAPAELAALCKPQELLVIAGRCGSGKSYAAMRLALALRRDQHRVMFLAPDVSGWLAPRILADTLGGARPTPEWGRFRQAKLPPLILENDGLLIDDSGPRSVRQLDERIGWAARNRFDFLIIDSLNNIAGLRRPFEHLRKAAVETGLGIAVTVTLRRAAGAANGPLTGLDKLALGIREPGKEASIDTLVLSQHGELAELRKPARRRRASR